MFTSLKQIFANVHQFDIRGNKYLVVSVEDGLADVEDFAVVVHIGVVAVGTVVTFEGGLHVGHQRIGSIRKDVGHSTLGLEEGGGHQHQKGNLTQHLTILNDFLKVRFLDKYDFIPIFVILE